MLYIITFRLLEESPSHLTLPLLTSDNRNPDSETGRANSLFGMMPQFYSHIVDTWADSNCIHKLMLTASLVPLPCRSFCHCFIVELSYWLWIEQLRNNCGEGVGEGGIVKSKLVCKNLGVKEGRVYSRRGLLAGDWYTPSWNLY